MLVTDVPIDGINLTRNVGRGHPPILTAQRFAFYDADVAGGQEKCVRFRREHGAHRLRQRCRTIVYRGRESLCGSRAERLEQGQGFLIVSRFSIVPIGVS